MAEKTNTTLPNGRRIYSNTNEDGTKLYTDKNGRVGYSNVHVVNDEPGYGRTISIKGDDKHYSVFDELDETKARLAAECEAHETTKARLAHASRLHALTVLQLERAVENLRKMSHVVDSIEPECCEYCGECDPHSCEDDYTGKQYPFIEPIDEDPCFYASEQEGIARNTEELLAMIEDEEEEDFAHDEY